MTIMEEVHEHDRLREYRIIQIISLAFVKYGKYEYSQLNIPVFYTT
jgi:hypothetical protein